MGRPERPPQEQIKNPSFEGSKMFIFVPLSWKKCSLERQEGEGRSSSEGERETKPKFGDTVSQEIEYTGIDILNKQFPSSFYAPR